MVWRSWALSLNESSHKFNFFLCRSRSFHFSLAYILINIDIKNYYNNYIDSIYSVSLLIINFSKILFLKYRAIHLETTIKINTTIDRR